MSRHGGSKVSVWAVLSFCLIIVVFMSIFIGILWVYLHENRYDDVTGCRLDGSRKVASGQLVILMDITDKLDEDVADRVRSLLQRAVKEEPEGSLIEFYALDDRVTNYDRNFMHCMPRNPDNVKELTENFALVKQEFDRTFKIKLDNTIAELTSVNTSRSRSPICEMIKAVAIKSFSDNEIRVTGRKRLIVVSDFMQHFPGKFSMYDIHNRDRFDFTKFSHTNYGSALLLDDVNLHDVEVVLRYTKTMTIENVRFWEDYFRQSRAIVNKSGRI